MFLERHRGQDPGYIPSPKLKAHGKSSSDLYVFSSYLTFEEPKESEYVNCEAADEY